MYGIGECARTTTHRKTEKEIQLADGRGGKGVGEDPNHTTARQPGPLLIILAIYGPH
jgi:hypothetical protein